MSCSADGQIADASLGQRLIRAYQAASLCKLDLGDSMWKAFVAQYHHHLHTLLMDGDQAAVSESPSRIIPSSDKDFVTSCALMPIAGTRVRFG